MPRAAKPKGIEQAEAEQVAHAVNAGRRVAESDIKLTSTGWNLKGVRDMPFNILYGERSPEASVHDPPFSLEI